MKTKIKKYLITKPCKNFGPRIQVWTYGLQMSVDYHLRDNRLVPVNPNSVNPLGHGTPAPQRMIALWDMALSKSLAMAMAND